ncbi:MAG: hypothetical protein A2Y38_26640 [Spirochaetes bacterium GWB1_59_5]|nr:MAG: hypothetical protein A2Y38_26640 [Spirochaetes bacterium GWB1_59_5]
MEARRWGISHKYILFVSVAVFAFMVAAFMVTRTMLEDYALRAADETAALILDQTEKRLVSFFSEMEALSRSLASTAIVQSIDTVAMRDIFISSVVARSRYLRALYLGTADGRMYEWGVGAEFVDYAPSFPPDYDPRIRPWYRSALEKGDFSISAPYRYASVDDIGITCALPVSAPDGTLVGVLGLDILLRSLGSVLDGLAIPKGGKALILGSGGEIIASQFDEDRPEGMILKRFSAGDVLTSQTGSFSGSIGGQATQFVHQHIEKLDWIVVVAMPLGPIRESVRALLDLIGLVEVLLMVALVIALAIISGKLIVAPLGHIVSVINRVEGGQKGLRVSVSSSDEFGLLGDEFNRLLDTVEEYSSSLEDKVRTRTDELRKLQRENTRLRIIEERRRIYRDMHDTIGAKLTNIFFCNSVARDLAKDGPDRLRELLQSAETNCLQAVGSLKGIILGMSDDDRRANSFALAVSAGVRSRLEAAGIAFDCVVKDKHAIEELPSATLDELEKVIEELVSNVLKHSSASSVRLRLSLGASGLSFRFSDDGRGFDPRLTSVGSGIGNIRYRVESLGGSIRIEASPRMGSLYRILIPRAALHLYREPDLSTAVADR